MGGCQFEKQVPAEGQKGPHKQRIVESHAHHLAFRRSIGRVVLLILGIEFLITQGVVPVLHYSAVPEIQMLQRLIGDDLFDGLKIAAPIPVAG